MKFTIEDFTTNNTRVIETPLTFKTWLSIHFGAWGFYGIKQVNKKIYHIYDKFTGEITHTITR